MEFLNPAALYSLLLLPLLLIPYLIKGKPRQIVFSSLLLLRDFSARARGTPWGKLRLPPIFFLQLLFLLLLALTLGEPVSSISPAYIAVVFDNSASMQAIEENKSRFETAKDEVSNLLRGFSARAKVDLYVTVPRLERVGTTNLSPQEAVDLITRLSPYDLGEPPGNYGDSLSRLAKEKGYERLFFLTDHPAQGQSEAMRVISVGRPTGNLALTSFQISRASFVSPQLKARVEVSSFSSQRQALKLILKGGGRQLFSRVETIAPGKSVEFSFEGFPFHPYYEAELEVSDGLALDNRRFAIAPPPRTLEILAVSPRPESLYSLRSISGLSLKAISPEAYERTRGEGHSLEIFHYSAPVVLPQRHALFVLPPKENPLVAVGKTLAQPTITAWREPHLLTQYVNFALFRPTYGRPVKPLSFGEAILQSPEGVLALALEHEGFRYLVLGFDPFPYLGRENLPISIFTLNLLGWFHEVLGSSSAATGEPLKLNPGDERGTVVTPKGEKFPLQGGKTLFSRTFVQGVYELVRGKERRFIAVNLEDAKESNLTNPAAINLRRETAGQGGRPFLFSLWPYLLLLSLVLLLLEWFFNPPIARRRPFEPHGVPEQR
jgi:hypothetical protein